MPDPIQGLRPSLVDGIGFTDGTEAINGNPGAWQPGVLPTRKFCWLGQPNNSARPVTAAGVEQANPAAAPAVAASAESGTANAAVTTTNTTLVDTRKAWLVNEYVGSTVTCNGKTMVVVSNTATTLTGTAWSGGGNPGNGFLYTIATALSTDPSGYRIAFTWVYNTTAPAQETFPSALASIAITAGQKITYTIPAFPANVVAANVYIMAAPLGPPQMLRGFKRQHATAGTYDLATNAVTTQNLFPPSVNEQFGSIYLPAITPTGVWDTSVSVGVQAAVAANTSVERTLTVNGVLVGDRVVAINKPTHQAGLGIVNMRVSAANTIAWSYMNNTAASITPTNESYIFSILSRPAIFSVQVFCLQVAAKSRVFFSIRQGSTTPSVGSIIVPRQIAVLTPGQWFLVALLNVGSVASLATDFILDYLILDGAQ